MSDSTRQTRLRREFSYNGYTYTYCYSDLEFGQREEARSIALLHQERIINPPRSDREREASGDSQWLPRMIAHLLKKKLPDGGLEPYDPSRVESEILPFVLRFNAEDSNRADEVRRDFFAQIGITDYGLIRAYSASRMLAVQAQSVLGMTQNGSDEPESKTDSNTSSTLENSTTDSERIE